MLPQALVYSQLGFGLDFGVFVAFSNFDPVWRWDEPAALLSRTGSVAIFATAAEASAGQRTILVPLMVMPMALPCFRWVPDAACPAA